MTGSLSFESLREQIVGVDARIETPFGQRLMTYCDYTASGRCLTFIENYLQRLQRTYANTHTEDDTTGRNMTRLLHEAEDMIKRSVNAGASGRIIATGTGATGAITKLQQILGVYCPPATCERIEGALGDAAARTAFHERLAALRPVVFVGPFEHHSNEVSWRQGLCTVVEARLAADGGVDMAHLESLLARPEYQGRLRIGSFSAASNVTGMTTDVHGIARLLHRHDAIACFDYAASAPYVEIDMNPAGDPDAALDAVFISPHKFLGGPGSSGVLVFHERLYRRELPPTVAAGGTVDYVSEHDQDFIHDIEEREKAGTPGTLQVIKAALAFAVKDDVSVPVIETREQHLLGAALTRWRRHAGIEVLGNPDPSRRIAIVSFNLRDSGGRYLHPKLVTALLNDLFGIQSRAGCSCAGPYGHRLLNIDAERSGRYRAWVGKGFGGIKPGWCRLGFHYTMDAAEADYVVRAVEFLAEYGERFVPLYRFDLASGVWSHREEGDSYEPLALERAIAAPKNEASGLPAAERRALYQEYLDAALAQARRLSATAAEHTLEDELAELQFFSLCGVCVGKEGGG